MRNLVADSDVNQFLASNERVLLRFTAAWCGPCQAIKPHVEQLEQKTPLVAFGVVDLDASQAVAAKYNVTAVPTFIFFLDGKEIDRVRGADVRGIQTALASLAGKKSANPSGGNVLGTSTSGAGAGASAGASSSGPVAAGDAAIPAGFESLNNYIDFRSAELLNVESEDPSAQLRDLFGPGESPTVTDADSQLIAFIPLQNKVTVSKILIKIPQDLDGSQVPTQAKIWSSLPHALSFEDACADRATFETDVPPPNDDGWCEIPLKYVLFQKVSTLQIFLTGEDEESQTVLSRIVVVGRAGEARAQASLKHDEEED